MSQDLDRRNFLKVGVAGALGVATSGLSLRALSQVNAALAKEEVRVPWGPESVVPSVCSMCPAGCGLRVRKVGERAVHAQGNPLHPVNHGGICPKGAAAIQELYHPDRLRKPLRNTGSREKPQWKEISWDAALDEIATRLKRLRDAGQAQSMVFVDRGQRNLCSQLFRSFLEACGSPNYFTRPSGMDALQTAVYLQQGITQPIAYDFENTRYLLSFGVNLLEGWGSPVTIMRAFGRWRDSASGRQTKFVQVESRLSVTAAKADEWIALRPGTDAALALGIAYVLISEGLYDASFVAERTYGFDDWHDADGRQHLGFRSLVFRDYRLDDVSRMTGVPPETILRIARELGHNRPAMVIGDRQTSTLPGDPYAAMAVHSLNALLGSFEVPGGVLVQQPTPAPDGIDVASGQTSSPALGQGKLHGLPDAILSRKPYATEVLILNEVDPVFEQPQGDSFRQALHAVPFVVSLSAFVNESSALADIVLPMPVGLERWQDGGPPATFPYSMQSISPPAVKSRFDVRDSADVVIALAHRLGEPVSAKLPFDSLERYLRTHSDNLFAQQSGAVFAASLEERWDRLLERSGWWAPSYATADELWSQIKERGGWWEPSYPFGEWDRVLQTPSRRFEFYSQALNQRAEHDSAFAQANGFAPGDDRLCLPHQRPIAQAPRDFPLQLVPVEVLPLAGGNGAHLPYLQQIAGLHVFEHWESWVEIDPITASKNGIGDGDTVWVESKHGRVQARARLYAGVRPDVVHMPLGYGRTEGGNWACRGANPLSIIEPEYEPVAGLPQTANTYVKLYRS